MFINLVYPLWFVVLWAIFCEATGFGDELGISDEIILDDLELRDVGDDVRDESDDLKGNSI